MKYATRGIWCSMVPAHPRHHVRHHFSLHLTMTATNRFNDLLALPAHIQISVGYWHVEKQFHVMTTIKPNYVFMCGNFMKLLLQLCQNSVYTVAENSNWWLIAASTNSRSTATHISPSNPSRLRKARLYTSTTWSATAPATYTSAPTRYSHLLHTPPIHARHN